MKSFDLKSLIKQFKFKNNYGSNLNDWYIFSKYSKYIEVYLQHYTCRDVIIQ